MAMWVVPVVGVRTDSLSERLVQDLEHLNRQLETLPPGPERNYVVRRIRQNETASHIDQWLTSPGLQTPRAIEDLGK
jgi:hypothetical protein